VNSFGGLFHCSETIEKKRNLASTENPGNEASDAESDKDREDYQALAHQTAFVVATALCRRDYKIDQCRLNTARRLQS
jgi:hypothetical protein